MSKGNKWWQICRRLLSLFESAANAAHFIGRMAKGMVSSLYRLRMKARRPREIRLGRMLADAPLISWRQSRGVVRVNRRFDCGSPVAASRSFRPVSLRLLDPTPGSGESRLGFRARRISFARYRGEPEVSPPSFSRDPVTKDNVSNGILFD